MRARTHPRWLTAVALAMMAASFERASSAADDHRAPAPGPRPRRPATSSGARLAGQYQCAQGWTALELELRFSGAIVEATFNFHHEATGTRGSYRLRGSRASSGEIALAPLAWIRRPPGYIMVGMQGRIGNDGVFRGTITHPSCGEFVVAPSGG